MDEGLGLGMELGGKSYMELASEMGVGGVEKRGGGLKRGEWGVALGERESERRWEGLGQDSRDQGDKGG